MLADGTQPHCFRHIDAKLGSFGAPGVSHGVPANTKGYSSTYLAMGFANVRAGTQKRLPFSDELQAPFLSCGSPQAALKVPLTASDIVTRD